LSDVPTYNSPEELNPLLDRVLGDIDATEALAEKLFAVVKERHSFRERAGDFARITAAIA
jgi:spore maturation protein CgeB